MFTNRFVTQARQAIHFARLLIRWDHWYESKVPLFFIVGYTMLILHGASLSSFFNYIRLALFAIFFLAFGYALNDFSDRHIDRQVGKTNAIAELPPRSGLVILMVLFITGFAWLPAKDWRSISLASLAYFFIIFYSLPPIRFKERGLMGLIVAAAAQRTLPALLFFEAYRHWRLDTLLLSLLFFFIGLRWIIGHQLWDMANDLRSGVQTYATTSGKRRLERWLAYFIFPTEVGLSITSVLFYFTELPWLIFLLIGYFFWLGYTIRQRSHAGLPFTLFAADWIPLADFYFIIWPLYLALILALEQPLFWIVFVGNLIWQHWSIMRHIYSIQRWALARRKQ